MFMALQWRNRIVPHPRRRLFPTSSLPLPTSHSRITTVEALMVRTHSSRRAVQFRMLPRGRMPLSTTRFLSWEVLGAGMVRHGSTALKVKFKILRTSPWFCKSVLFTLQVHVSPLSSLGSYTIPYLKKKKWLTGTDSTRYVPGTILNAWQTPANVILTANCNVVISKLQMGILWCREMQRANKPVPGPTAENWWTRQMGWVLWPSTLQSHVVLVSGPWGSSPPAVIGALAALELSGLSMWLHFYSHFKFLLTLLSLKSHDL